MLGVNLGFTLMLVLVGLGLGTLFQQLPWLYTVLKYAGALYLLYLAWKIAMAGPLAGGRQRGRPFTFLQAVQVPWGTHNAWVMAVGVSAHYNPPSGFYFKQP